MENFKQQLDQEMGPKRFDAAMQERIHAHIKTHSSPIRRKDFRYVLAMISAFALVVLFLVVMLATPYKQLQTTAAINDPVKSFYANVADEDETFHVVASDFDLNSTHVRNAKKVSTMQTLLNKTKEVNAIPKSAYHDVDLIVVYDNGDKRAFQFYSDFNHHYWFYDRETKRIYKGTYEEDVSIYEIVENNTEIFLLFFIGVWAFNWILPRLMNRLQARLGMTEPPEKYVSNKHRQLTIASSIFTFVGIIVAFFIVKQAHFLYAMILIYVPFLVDFYYEYRYRNMYRQYINTFIRIVLISIYFFIFLYVRTYF